MRPIGLHLRLSTTLSDLLKKSVRIESPIMQCFFVLQSTNRYVKFSPEEIEECRTLTRNWNMAIVHASYWVNLAGCTRNGWRAFMRELEYAKSVGFTHIVIHPGSATGCRTKDEGIECLARALNKVLATEDTITIVLENAAHARMSVGGDLEDFRKLLLLLEHPEKIAFCIDTAHAHSYGYDVISPKGQDAFLSLAHEIMGDKLQLLHLNNTTEKRGSRIDKHSSLEGGQFGEEALKRFMNHPVCKNVPIILEIPITKNEDEEKDILQRVTSWEE